MDDEIEKLIEENPELAKAIFDTLKKQNKSNEVTRLKKLIENNRAMGNKFVGVNLATHRIKKTPELKEYCHLKGYVLINEFCYTDSEVKERTKEEKLNDELQNLLKNQRKLQTMLNEINTRLSELRNENKESNKNG